MSKSRLGLAVAGSTCALLLAGAVAAGAFPLLTGGDQTPAAKLTGSASPVDGIYPMGSIEAPKLIKEVKFVRPDGAPPATTKTIVVLGLVINDQGVPTQITVLKSDNDVLSKATMEAVSQFRWAPPMLDGKPVSVRWTITVGWGTV